MNLQNLCVTISQALLNTAMVACPDSTRSVLVTVKAELLHACYDQLNARLARTSAENLHYHCSRDMTLSTEYNKKRHVVNLNTPENFVTTLNIPEVYNFKVASSEHVPAEIST